MGASYSADPIRFTSRRLGTVVVAVMLAGSLTAASHPATAQAVREPAGSIQTGTAVSVAASARVNFADLAAQERLAQGKGVPEVRPLIPSELNEAEDELQPEPGARGEVNFPPGVLLNRPPLVPYVASPAPTGSYMGLNDIAMVDSSYIVIPPDVAGGVGPSRVMESFNNNYRIRDKATGATLLTVGTATFWNPVVADKTLLNQLTDPRTTYDPIQNRWIVAMQTANATGLILFGVSQTSDPAGSWFLYAVSPGFTGAPRLDFPILGFNKNWLVVTINAYTSGGAFSRGGTMIANYPQAAAGTLASATNITQASGTHFCSAPCVTLSATEDTLFLVTHLSSGSATYQVDIVTGTPSAPVYTSGGTNIRPGGGWTQPSGNQLPQSAPNSGASACGATPCPIETQDAQVRSAPTFRVDGTSGRGYIYYAQTVGLPAGLPLTHTLAQWTKLTASTIPAFADGGRIEDPTATATNGGKWYAYTHIAVNANGDFMVGYAQFSSAQHPAAGYSVHLAGDGVGTIRDPLIYHAGEDYYHKTFSTATGRNRWGDFSTAQVDPSDDMTLWVLQEYARTRTSTDDGNTGSNGSKWSSWWAALAPPRVTIDVGPSQNEGNSGTTTFAFTARLSYAYGLPVTVNFQTADGSATVADNDYQALTSSVIIPAGSTTATINIDVVGDTKCEPNETFSVTVTAANNKIPLGATLTATGTIVNDEQSTITASAGAGGTITPSGAVVVNCSASQGFTIAPDLCHAIADVVVDGVSQGVQTTYTFNNVTANHTISASFTPLMTLSQTHTDASCNGSANGAIDLTVNGGTGPLTYAWSNGATTQDISGLVAASYSVTVTDANGCTANLTVPVGQPAVLALSETHVDLAACGATNGSIDLSVAGGTAPYGYSWTNGATTQDLTGLAAGTYTVTVTDAHACQAFKSVTILAPGAPSLSETHVNVSCQGGSNGSVDLTVTGGTGPFTYAWSNGATTQDLSGLAAGTYNVTVTDANNCTALLGATVTQPALLTLSETHVNVCTGGSNGSVDLTVAGGTAPYGYAWSNGATSEDLSGLAAGTYNVTVTDAHGCTQGLGVTITVTQLAIVSTAGSNGTISPLGTTNVPCGTDQTYMITPDPGYTVSSLLVDASSVIPTTSYTFNNVTAPHTIDVTFGLITAVATPTAQFALGQVVPNPTRGAMQVSFGLPESAPVHVSIIDPQGRELAVLADGEYPAGWHAASWNGRSGRGAAGAGLYFVRYRMAGQTVMKKFVLTR